MFKRTDVGEPSESDFDILASTDGAGSVWLHFWKRDRAKDVLVAKLVEDK